MISTRKAQITRLVEVTTFATATIDDAPQYLAFVADGLFVGAMVVHVVVTTVVYYDL